MREMSDERSARRVRAERGIYRQPKTGHGLPPRPDVNPHRI